MSEEGTKVIRPGELKVDPMSSRCSDLGERMLIDRISEALGLVDQDDCAVIDWGEDHLVATTDMLHEETDFPPSAEPWQMGWMSVAVNLSDLAAMGAEPLGVLLAVGLPPETELDYLDSLFEGFRDCALAYGTRVLGGDTDSHRELTVTGTALGRVERTRVLRRKGARPGDLLCTTGTLGGAGGGLELLKRGDPKGSDALVKMLLEPKPRLREGRALALSGAVTSMMDNSDGLALSLHDLARAGGVGFLVEEEALPLALGTEEIFGRRKALELALHAGGDFELLFTVGSDTISAAKRACDLTVIGSATDGGIWMHSKSKRWPLASRGYEHMRG